MTFRSRYPDADIPSVCLAEFVLGAPDGDDGRPAFVDGTTGRSLSFGEVRTQVRRLAAGLSGRVGKADVVALWAPNVPEYAVVFHAVLSLGAVLTTINPAYTSQEAAFQLRDANAILLITTAALSTRALEAVDAAGTAIAVITIDEAPGLASLAALAIDADPPRVAIDPAVDIAVLPYSSGTTGLAKGVMLTHRNLVANLQQVNALEVPDLPALVGVLPFFHIYGMTVIMNLGLVRRATVVTLPRFELDAFLQVLQDWPIPVAHIVPPIAVALAKHPAVDRYDLHGVTWLFSGAAPLGAELTAAIRTRLGITTRQGYGLTETSPAVYYTPPGAERDGKVGLLVPGTECRIVCPETGRVLATNEPGEVLIRGPQVMKGYWNNPEATAATIDPDGWLRTGDIGVVDDEGYLTVVDRLKELIKVKGYQVAPAELESLLLEHPQIADVAVIPVADEEAGEVPKACVVARGPLTASDVMEFIAPRVAYYKRIRHVEFIESIPKSPSGKILRRVLRDRPSVEPREDPMSPVETITAAYAAFGRNDPSVLFGAMDPSITWNEAEGNPLADRNPYVGPQAIGDGVFGRLLAAIDNFTAVPTTIIDGGDHVVVLGRYGGTIKAGGASLDAPYCHVYRFRDGKVVTFQQYTDTAQWARLME